MDKCPVEICLHIFQFACTDDGKTGRSLSLVSRSVHDLSREAKLQSISVVGLGQILGFAALLDSTPAKYRRVCHLFLSNCPQLESPTSEVCGRIEEPANQSVGAVRHYGGACDAFTRILEFVAPTLRTFRLVSNISRTTTLLPVSLPALVELTIYGPFPAWTYPESKLCMFRSLRHLRFVGFTDYPMDMFEDIEQQAPGLTHLSLLPGQASRHLHLDLEMALNISQPPGSSGEDAFPRGKLPPTLQRVYVQPGPEPTVVQGQWFQDVHKAMLTSLLRMAKIDKRIVVLKSGPICNLSETKMIWMHEHPTRLL